jgi:glycosyltransferase involved in cell wall biosynthesis
LVEAMKIVKQTCPVPVRLVMVGKGALRDAIAREIACAGLDKEVRILESDRVEDLLRGCDGFVLPSDTEACPCALLEALSSGLPCIVTDTFGNEFITDGQEGIVVPVRDPRRLAEAIGALAQDGQQRRRMGKAARALAEKKYGLDSMVSKYVAIYEALGCR